MKMRGPIWTTAAWNGRDWELPGTIRSDNNYDMGSIYLERDDLWRIIGPTEPGPQAYNTGGEIALVTVQERAPSSGSERPSDRTGWSATRPCAMRAIPLAPSTRQQARSPSPCGLPRSATASS